MGRIFPESSPLCGIFFLFFLSFFLFFSQKPHPSLDKRSLVESIIMFRWVVMGILRIKRAHVWCFTFASLPLILIFSRHYFHPPSGHLLYFLSFSISHHTQAKRGRSAPSFLVLFFYSLFSCVFLSNRPSSCRSSFPLYICVYVCMYACMYVCTPL